MNAVSLHRPAHWLHVRGVPILPRIFEYLVFFLFNSYIPASAVIGIGSRCAYGGIGVVVHRRARVGRNVLIGQQVTIGGRSGHQEVPVIEDDVYLGAGCKVLGPIRVGRGAVVGANAVVLHDVPAGAVVAGVPARVVKVRTPHSDDEHPTTTRVDDAE